MSQTQDTIALSETRLPAEAAERVDAIAAAINFNDPSLTVAYGAQTMNAIAQFADGLLGQVRSRDAGPVGDALTDLLVNVKHLDTAGLKESGGMMERLPLVGRFFNSYEKTLARFNTLSGQVDAVTSKLEQAMVGLVRDVEMLEQLFALNRDFHNELTLYIEAGRKRLDEARTVELPRIRAEAEASGDTMQAQAVRDFAERLDRFEKRLHDLDISRTITLQTAPQIRLLQNNDQTLAEKIQTSILATIPIWKNQMVLALSLHRQQNAAKLQKQVSDTTNDLLRKNADMLRQTSVDTAREMERSVVDMDTLRTVQAQLVATIEDTLRIAGEGRQQRREAEKELRSMEDDLRLRLTQLANDKDRLALEGQLPAAPAGLPAGRNGGLS